VGGQLGIDGDGVEQAGQAAQIRGAEFGAVTRQVFQYSQRFALGALGEGGGYHSGHAARSCGDGVVQRRQRQVPIRWPVVRQ